MQNRKRREPREENSDSVQPTPTPRKRTQPPPESTEHLASEAAPAKKPRPRGSKRPTGAPPASTKPAPKAAVARQRKNRASRTLSASSASAQSAAIVEKFHCALGLQPGPPVAEPRQPTPPLTNESQRPRAQGRHPRQHCKASNKGKQPRPPRCGVHASPTASYPLLAHECAQTISDLGGWTGYWTGASVFHHAHAAFPFAHHAAAGIVPCDMVQSMVQHQGCWEPRRDPQLVSRPALAGVQHWAFSVVPDSPACTRAAGASANTAPLAPDRSALRPQDPDTQTDFFLGFDRDLEHCMLAAGSDLFDWEPDSPLAGPCCPVSVSSNEGSNDSSPRVRESGVSSTVFEDPELGRVDLQQSLHAMAF